MTGDPERVAALAQILAAPPKFPNGSVKIQRWIAARRIAAGLDGRDVVFHASHGVTVVGRTLAWAFDDLYYLDRACMHQVLATQAAAGRPLRQVPDALCARVAAQIDGERAQSDLMFASLKRLLDRDEPGWRVL
jgi:ribulose-5-phosphate 4-epimerase/fuculose-1-phosphate aldolase